MANKMTTLPGGRLRSWRHNHLVEKIVANRTFPALPPAVPLDLDATLRDYWRLRCPQQSQDSYAGVPLLKLPEDLRVYEHLLWMCRPNTVIELGGLHGGSALWFRDRLRTLATYGLIQEPRVISVDRDIRYAHYALSSVDPDYARQITLVVADLLDSALPDQVASLLPDDARCLVVEDSAHNYEVTTSALNGFARFVPLEGFFVVEDGYVDIEPMRYGPAPELPRGVLPAISEWLSTDAGRQFTTRRDLEVYGLSSNPNGYLQRVAPAS